MKREWKAGDVGASAVGERFIVSSRGECFWSGADKDDWSGLSGKPSETDRPLLVIDPEDREQIGRLVDLWGANEHLDCGSGSCAVDTLQTALREYANPKPPKPPTDVAARVTDRRDNIWRLLADGEWVCVDGPDHGEYLTWDGLTERGPLEVSSS